MFDAISSVRASTTSDKVAASIVHAQRTVPITYKQTGALIPVIAALYSPIRVHTRIAGCSSTGMAFSPLRHAQSISTGLYFHDASDSCCTSRCLLDPVTLPAATLSDLVSWDSRQPPSGLATLDFL